MRSGLSCQGIDYGPGNQRKVITIAVDIAGALFVFKTGPKGFEPSISCVTGRRDKPDYTTGPLILLKKVIEPALRNTGNAGHV